MNARRSVAINVLAGYVWAAKEPGAHLDPKDDCGHEMKIPESEVVSLLVREPTLEEAYLSIRN